MTDINEKINNLSSIEQSLQHMANQKKNFQTQLLETDTALNEISDESFKIIGNFMFKKNAAQIKEELEEKKELLNIRIRSFEKEEKEIEQKFKTLQEEVMADLSKKNK